MHFYIALEWQPALSQAGHTGTPNQKNHGLKASRCHLLLPLTLGLARLRCWSCHEGEGGIGPQRALRQQRFPVPSHSSTVSPTGWASCFLGLTASQAGGRAEPSCHSTASCSGEHRLPCERNLAPNQHFCKAEPIKPHHEPAHTEQPTPCQCPHSRENPARMELLPPPRSSPGCSCQTTSILPDAPVLF